MRSIAFLFAAVVSVVNVASTYACDDCGCKLDAANGHEHLDDGHAHMDADNVYKSEYSESLAQCAIETYGELGEKRMLLTAKAEEGCNHSRKSLRAEEIKSIKEMIEMEAAGPEAIPQEAPAEEPAESQETAPEGEVASTDSPSAAVNTEESPSDETNGGG